MFILAKECFLKVYEVTSSNSFNGAEVYIIIMMLSDTAPFGSKGTESPSQQYNLLLKLI